jgi:hypothetical protein
MRTLRNTTLSGWILCAAMGLVSASPRQAMAQDRDPAAAEALFDQARELSRAGRYNEACPKFLESNRLDPGIGTQFHLADCYEQSGRLASAWAMFLDVASLARSSNQPDREKAASKRAAALKPRLPRLLLNVPDASQLPGLEIRRDDVLMGAALWGTPVPVDPGVHEITMSAPGHRTLKQTVKLEQGKSVNLDLPALIAEDSPVAVQPPMVAAPAEAPPAPAPPTPAPQASAPVPKSDAAPSSGAGPLPWALAGAGVVGFGVGTVFALLATSANSKSKSDCDADNVNVCGSTGVSQRNDARRDGNIATVGFVAGGALLAGAGILWLAGGHSKESAASPPRGLRANAAVAPGSAAVYLQGSF